VTIAEAVLQFAVVAGLLTVVPGLDTALVLRATLVHSRAYGLATTTGIQIGTLIWGVAAATGAAAVLAASQSAYRVLTILGAAYMVWLGASMLWKTFRRQTSAPAVAADVASSPKLRRGFTVGLATNLMNPKVGVFYIAMIPQFVPDGVSPLWMGLLLAAMHCVLGTAWSCSLIGGAGFFKDRLAGSTAVRWIDRITGGVLIAFGTRLALAPRA
jgi:threonine/homoserine/homoserine lactone efflux protein